MLLLVSGSTKTVKRLHDEGEQGFGCLVTPDSGNSIDRIVGMGLPWAADNGCFKGLRESAFRSLLRRVSGRAGLLWVVCPDKVADARTTLFLFECWEPVLREAGVPIAFVAQDGAKSASMPWDLFQALFIGGSTDFKIGKTAASLAKEAKARGKWLHMGRVNSYLRLTVAADFGCDSVDGSSASMFGDRYISKYCRWVRKLKSGHLPFATRRPVPLF